MRPKRTWILIADGARARILENDGPGKGIRPVAGLTFEAPHAATHDIVDEREGRTYSSVGTRRSAIEARRDPHRALKTEFAKLLADRLASAHAQAHFDRLVIVAPPATLGDLRHALSPHVTAVVMSELAQDLTKMSDTDVASHLLAALPL